MPVCPTGASYKREDNGVVLVDYDKCIGCKYCAWACPYGVREFDQKNRVMKKCTLCIDRVTDMTLPESERKPACVLSCPTSAQSLKYAFLLLVFVLPVILIAAAHFMHSSALPMIAFAVQYLGLMAERWYFFAEAKHPQNLYYQSMA